MITDSHCTRCWTKWPENYSAAVGAWHAHTDAACAAVLAKRLATAETALFAIQNCDRSVDGEIPIRIAVKALRDLGHAAAVRTDVGATES